MEVGVLNRQRARKIGTEGLARFLRRVASELPAMDRGSVAVCLVSDRAIRDLNRRFRGKDQATDVLAFPSGSREGPGGPVVLGDVVVAVPRAARQAAERGHSLDRELRILALHGFLHLLGYDHERDDGEMLRLQRVMERRLLPPRGRRKGK